ncbi:hypothetical protein LXL04_037384 [Taraxacum kok-saghyz]
MEKILTLQSSISIDPLNPHLQASYSSVHFPLLVIMSVRNDWDWMYKKSYEGYLSMSYKAKVKDFLDVACSNEVGDFIRCPCFRCKNKFFKTREEVELHLLQRGFTPNYTTWWAHGEREMLFQHEGQSSDSMQDRNPIEDDGVMEDDDVTEDGDVNGCTCINPEPSAQGFYDALEEANEPLWDRCENYTKLQAASELLNWKSEYNVSEAAYDHILPIIKRMLPKGEKLVENFYETKKVLKRIRIPEMKIRACKNHCMIFYGADSDLTKCRVCDHDRYKPNRLSLIPYLVLRYLLIAPRLQRLHLSKTNGKTNDMAL